jgi:hypothetical protein
VDPHRAAIIDEQWQAALQLWNSHRLRQPLRRCDAIGLGSHDIGVARHAAEMFHAGWFPLVVFSGAENPIWPEQFPDGEAAHFRDEAILAGVPASAILVESDATNTGAEHRPGPRAHGFSPAGNLPDTGRQEDPSTHRYGIGKLVHCRQ